ncbi:hypothetical protein N5W20_01160 [Candidatus Kirkpatrickella diaphorinae]|uniref:Uncharacterized protein n=1 Tax=Candidatus Kirkpatrickella diaphorinae TaxID=2984322 RepID=A0ABY6GL27_9PROT|nr:hypothetical protein [Candidatus Kirkpatrickella diaphorinae]UYH51520.1 hypothetical protein N5W20_01160 [Candidatus Kirkpatrickella diaphorinae]
MTNDELVVIRQINGDDAVYDAHLSGYDVIVPVQIHQDGARCAVKHHMKEIFFSAALIIDMTVKAA